MTPWHCNVLRITGRLLVNPGVTGGITFQGTSNSELWHFHCCKPGQVVSGPVELLMSWNVMTILSRHFNVASASIVIAVVYTVLFYIGGFYDKFQTMFIICFTLKSLTSVLDLVFAFVITILGFMRVQFHFWIQYEAYGKFFMIWFCGSVDECTA